MTPIEKLPEYTTTSVENSLLIMRAINRILWWEEMERIMPLVAKELIKMGVNK